MIKAILVDDEAKALATLSEQLALHCPEVRILGTAGDTDSAYRLVNQLQPDLVFLDIEMPGNNGFELLTRFEKVPFQVIFTTAYDQFALKAFRFSALDYLLKPIIVENLVEAVGRVRIPDRHLNTQPGIENFIQNWQTRELKRLAVPDLKGVAFIQLRDLVFLEADRNYSILHLTGGERMVSTKTLKDYELLLEEQRFYRVHHTYLVNLQQVERFQKEDGGYLIMRGGDRVEVSRRRKGELLDQLSRI